MHGGNRLSARETLFLSSSVAVYKKTSKIIFYSVRRLKRNTYD
ncbi:hypothetical protein DDI_2650 [Dickeya dianthicola RNS04.9]|nr:hypothetical protein DDI_2650 [Dickeya dianthicola RNS04.9]